MIQSKQVIFFLFCFFLWGQTKAQNLIENGSFELTNGVIVSFGELDKVQNWSSLSGLGLSGNGTPDVFSLSSGFIPKGNLFYFSNIYSQPSEGDNWIGLLISRTDNVREYAEYKFKSKLVPNLKYNFSFKFSNGTIDSNTRLMTLTNCIQIHFSNNLITQFSADPIYIENPTVTNNNVLSSPNVWTKLEYEFELQDSVQYMTIGNFCKNENMLVDTLDVGNDSINKIFGPYSYYFFDDFVLEKVPQPITGDTLHTVCIGDEVELKISGDKNNKWYNSKKQLVAQNIERFTIIADTNTTYIIVGVTDTLEIKVVVNPKPKQLFGKETKVCEVLVLESKTQLYDSIKVNPQIENNIFVQNGEYQLTSWLGSCPRVDTTIFEIEDCEVVLQYPNIFTPNGDGKNEVFTPQKVKNIARGEFRVYNRWGKEIFFTEDILEGWNGNQTSTGVYYYICDFVDRFGKEDLIKGWVLLEK